MQGSSSFAGSFHFVPYTGGTASSLRLEHNAGALAFTCLPATTLHRFWQLLLMLLYPLTRAQQCPQMLLLAAMALEPGEGLWQGRRSRVGSVTSNCPAVRALEA